jgi:hypothetical protein
LKSLHIASFDFTSSACIFYQITLIFLDGPELLSLTRQRGSTPHPRWRVGLIKHQEKFLKKFRKNLLQSLVLEITVVPSLTVLCPSHSALAGQKR